MRNLTYLQMNPEARVGQTVDKKLMLTSSLRCDQSYKSQILVKFECY
jgi:hypothetical protein